MFRLIKQIFAMTWRQRWMHLAACAALLTAKTLLIALPFRWVIRLLGIHLQSQPSGPPDHRHQQLQPWGQVLKACARRLPFSATCLVQAVAGAMILKVKRRPMAILIGVQKTPDGHVTAHAWLLCDGEVVTGGRTQTDYHIIAKWMGKRTGGS